MPNVPSLTELLQAGVHFGHQTSKWHPKMKKYLFGSRQGIHIINLEETQKALDEAMSFVKKTTIRGGVVLFVGTKKQAAGLVAAAATSCGMQGNRGVRPGACMQTGGNRFQERAARTFVRR